MVATETLMYMERMITGVDEAVSCSSKESGSPDQWQVKLLTGTAERIQNFLNSRWSNSSQHDAKWCSGIQPEQNRLKVMQRSAKWPEAFIWKDAIRADAIAYYSQKWNTGQVDAMERIAMWCNSIGSSWMLLSGIRLFITLCNAFMLLSPAELEPATNSNAIHFSVAQCDAMRSDTQSTNPNKHSFT